LPLRVGLETIRRSRRTHGEHAAGFPHHVIGGADASGVEPGAGHAQPGVESVVGGLRVNACLAGKVSHLPPIQRGEDCLARGLGQPAGDLPAHADGLVLRCLRGG